MIFIIIHHPILKTIYSKWFNKTKLIHLCYYYTIPKKNQTIFSCLVPSQLSKMFIWEMCHFIIQQIAAYCLAFGYNCKGITTISVLFSYKNSLQKCVHYKHFHFVWNLLETDASF